MDDFKSEQVIPKSENRWDNKCPSSPKLFYGTAEKSESLYGLRDARKMEEPLSISGVNTEVSGMSSTSDSKKRTDADNISQPMPSLKSGKRKRHTRSDSHANGQTNWQVSMAMIHTAKRSKPVSDISSMSAEGIRSSELLLYGLTAPIWQRIFGYLPPAALARLLRVCQPFRLLLTTRPQDLVENDMINDSNITPESEAIWRKCHQLFAPGVPFPARGQTELSMWKLIKGNRCQHCGLKKPLQTATGSPNVWSAGPGTEFVRVLWPFLSRLCGRCLHDQSQKEKELLLSNTLPSFLIDELPFMFVLESGDCVSESVLRENVLPLGLRFSKIFYKPQIARLKQTYYHFAQDSLDSLDVWIKSLTASKAIQLQDSERWESWEVKGILAKVNRTKSNRPHQPKLPPKKSLDAGVTTASTGSSFGNSQPNIGTQLAPGLRKSGCYQNTEGRHSDLPMNPDELLKQPDAIARPRDFESSAGKSTILEARRNEIVKRCSYLDPPIGLELLDQMKSFHTSLQIEKEIDDQQWGILKERLIFEKPAADLRLQNLKNGVVCTHLFDEVDVPIINSGERDSTEQKSTSPSMLAPSGSGKSMSASVRNPVPIIDNIHERLAASARAVIRNDWNEGNSLSKDACSQFAAEVLLRAREIYLAESINMAQRGILSSHLTMEHMKWLFENFIKPLTEQHQKEIFLCRSCETFTKTYGFEAVVQHYAAKHTNLLSLGNAIVHWKAEWPQEPPFHPNPMRIKAHAIITSTSNNSQIQPLKPSDLLDHGVSHSSGLGAYSKAYEPRPANISSLQLTDETTSHLKQMELLPHTSIEVQSLSSSNPLSTPSAMHYYNVESNRQDVSHLDSHDTAYADMAFASPQFNSSSLSTGSLTQGIAVPTTEIFRAHQAEMAKFARELWFATAGIKGLSGPLRVQAIIHHASERFVKRFGVEPGVNMFLFGLNHEAAMRPLRSLNGFACRACTLGQPGSLPLAEQKKSQTLPHLLSHFMASHAEYYRLDWRRDMIQLPALKSITDLVNAPGMDETKLALFAAAFPSAYLFPSPSLNRVRQSTSFSISHDLAATEAHNMQSPVDHTSEKIAKYSGIIPAIQAGQIISSLNDNEYDPQKPSYLGRMVEGQWIQNSNLRHNSSIRQDLTPDHHSIDADRFLEELKPHLGESARSKLGPRPYIEAPRFYYDKVYIRDELDYHSNIPHSARARAIQPSLTKGLVQQQSQISTHENPNVSYHRSYQEYEPEVELKDGWETAFYYRASDGAIPADTFRSSASANSGQRSVSYHSSKAMSGGLIGQYTQSQHLEIGDVQRTSRYTRPEMMMVHTSQNMASNQADDSLYLAYGAGSHRARVAPGPGSFAH